MEGVDLILKGLEGVVALLLGAGARIAVMIRDVPLLRDGDVLLIALHDVGLKDLVNAVDGSAAVDVACHLGNDLRGYRSRGGDGLRGLDLGIAHLESLLEHASEIDEHAVEHREERGIVKIVEMDLSVLMGAHHIAGEHELLGVMAGDDAGKEVSLGGDDLGVLVGVLVEDVNIALLHEALDLLGEIVAALTGAVAVVAVLNIGPGYFLMAACHKLIFHQALDLSNVNLGDLLCRQLLLHALGNLRAERTVVHT